MGNGAMGTKDDRETPRNPTESHGTPIRGTTPSNPTCFGVFALSLFSFSHFPTCPNTRSFDCFATPCIGSLIEYRIDEMDHGHMGATDRCGTPRSLTDPRGTPVNGIFALAPTIFSRFSHFRSSRFRIPPFSNTQRFSGFATPGIGWRRNIGSRRKAIGRNGHPRNSATPRETMDNRHASTSGRRGTWRNLTEHQ